MSVLAVFVFAMPALLAAQRGRQAWLVLAVLLVAAHAGFGYVRLDVPPDTSSTKLRRAHHAGRRSTCAEKWDDSVRDRVFERRWTYPPARRRAGTPGRSSSLAGDVGALLLHRAAGCASRHRRDAGAGPDAGRRSGPRRRRPAGAQPLYYNSVHRYQRQTARSSMRSTKCISCPSANTYPFAGLGYACRHRYNWSRGR